MGAHSSAEWDETVAESLSGNDDPMIQVLACAIQIAGNAPAKQGQYSGEVKIYWPLIHQLRKALDDLGAEWRRS